MNCYCQCCQEESTTQELNGLWVCTDCISRLRLLMQSWGVKKVTGSMLIHMRAQSKPPVLPCTRTRGPSARTISFGEMGSANALSDLYRMGRHYYGE